MTSYPRLPRCEIQHLANNCKENRDTLVLSHVPMCIKIAARYASSPSMIGDLVHEGILGLYQACDRYDPDKGSFSTYAYWWVRKYIALYSERSRNTCEPLEHEVYTEGDTYHVDCRLDAEYFLSKLRPRAKYIVYQYALGRTYSEIAKDLGVSKQGVAYAHKRAMRHMMKEQL